MSKSKDAQDREESVHNVHYDSGSRNQRYTRPSLNFTWTRDSSGRDHTARFPSAVDLSASSMVTNPATRSSYRDSAHESPQYGHGPVYPQNSYGAHGGQSYGRGTRFHHSHGFHAHHRHNYRDHYRPSYGSRDYYPPSHGSRDYYSHYHDSSHHYPLQRVEASGPQSYGVRAPGYLPLSHGVAAGIYPSHGKGVHGFPSYEAGGIAPSLKFPAVSLYGLPRNCTEVDIIRFFDALDIVDVFLVFVNKIFSRRAFVVFSNAVAAGFALQKDKQKFVNTFVDISTCRRHDYYDAVAAAVNDSMDYGHPVERNDVNYHEGPNGQAARFKDSCMVRKRDTLADSKLHTNPDAQPRNLLDRNQGKPTRHILKVRGSPCSIDKKVILGVFGECNLSEDRARDVFHPDGTPTGEILLEFISQEDATKAMSMNKTMVESRLIEIVPYVEDSQITNTKPRQETDSQTTEKISDDKELTGPGAHHQSKPRSYYDDEQKVYNQILKLKSVPPSADMYDIIDFFSEFNLTLERLQVICSRDGIATGEVYVEFDSIEDARKAISKDKKTILSQCVELFPSSPDEASRAVSRFK